MLQGHRGQYGNDLVRAGNYFINLFGPNYFFNLSIHKSNKNAIPQNIIFLIRYFFNPLWRLYIYVFDQFLGLDDPCLNLLGPLLASPTSGLTPLTSSTCRNLVSTRSETIFDPVYFRNLQNLMFGLFTS